MKYIVTGAAGFIGSHLAEALLAAGHDVVGIDSFTDYYEPTLKERNASGLEVRRLDLARDELDLGGWDGIFHLAGQPGVRSFGDIFPLTNAGLTEDCTDVDVTIRRLEGDVDTDCDVTVEAGT